MVLHPPERSGEFLIVSFTDSENVTSTCDVWEAGWQVTPEFRLKKPSVLYMAFVPVVTQRWLDDRDTIYRGQCTDKTLVRARCNLCWAHDQIGTHSFPTFQAYSDDWYSRCEELD